VNEKWEQEILAKIDRGETLTDVEVADLVTEYATYEYKSEPDECDRWYNSMTTIVRISEPGDSCRLFSVEWREARDAEMYNDFESQLPVEVESYQEVIKVVKYRPITRHVKEN